MPDYLALMRKLKALGAGNEDQGTLSPDEWEVAYLYLAFVLRKVNFFAFNTLYALYMYCMSSFYYLCYTSTVTAPNLKCSMS